MTTDNEDTIKALADDMSHAVNVFGSGEQAIAAAFLNDHRTLVQRKAVVFLKFFRTLAAEAEHGWVDERNRESGRLAIVIRDAADDAGFGADLPFI
jgi:hypothetical protein